MFKVHEQTCIDNRKKYRYWSFSQSAIDRKWNRDYFSK